jgi:hypothetical protein
MRVVSLALGLVAAAVSIPLLALGAYGLWLFPGCLNDLGDLFPPLGRRLCMDSYLKTSLATSPSSTPFADTTRSTLVPPSQWAAGKRWLPPGTQSWPALPG